MAARTHRIGRWWLVTIAVVASQAVQAEPLRARKLRFDTNRKEWVEVAPPTPGTAEGDLHAIRGELEGERYHGAKRAIERFVKKYGEDHALHPDLLIAKAEMLIGSKEYDRAHETLQVFLAKYRGIAQTDEALRLEFVIAETFLSGVKRKVWGLRMISGEDLAFQILDEIATDHPESPLAELAIKIKADYQFDSGDHGLAELDYGRLMREYPKSRYHQYAMSRSADAALASFAGVYYDEAALVEADARYQEYQARYPGASSDDDVDLILDGIREKRAEKEFAIGSYYERTGHVSSAVYYYELVRTEWPRTIAAGKATGRLVLLGALEAAPAEPGSRGVGVDYRSVPVQP